LQAHLYSVVTVMKLNNDGDYDGFIEMLDKVKPRYDKTLPLPLDKQLLSPALLRSLPSNLRPPLRAHILSTSLSAKTGKGGSGTIR
jgi:hypothetical protein